jgi:predicted RNA-binding Zn ribbon-like protein
MCDLLNVLLAARLVGAENVDRGRITEAEYQLQLAELNARITNEKRRRTLADAQASASLQASQAQSAAALLARISRSSIR